MSAEKVIVGALAGFAAGALVGVLFAPDKGTETRKKILSKKDDLGDALREKFESFLDSLSISIDEAADEAEGLSQRAKSYAKEKTAEAKRELNAAL
jgi:gas vesicle protein